MIANSSVNISMMTTTSSSSSSGTAQQQQQPEDETRTASVVTATAAATTATTGTCEKTSLAVAADNTASKLSSSTLTASSAVDAGALIGKKTALQAAAVVSTVSSPPLLASPPSSSNSNRMRMVTRHSSLPVTSIATVQQQQLASTRVPQSSSTAVISVTTVPGAASTEAAVPQPLPAATERVVDNSAAPVPQRPAEARIATRRGRGNSSGSGGDNGGREGHCVMTDESESSAISTLTPRGANMATGLDHHVDVVDVPNMVVSSTVTTTSASSSLVKAPAETGTATLSLTQQEQQQQQHLQYAQWDEADPKLTMIRRIIYTTCQSVLRHLRQRQQHLQATLQSYSSHSNQQLYTTSTNTASDGLVIASGGSGNEFSSSYYDVASVYTIFHDLQHCCCVVPPRRIRTSDCDNDGMDFYFYMDAFCAAIRRPDVTATVTTMILDAWITLVQYDSYLSFSTKRLQSMALALTQCAFEETSSSPSLVPFTASSALSTTTTIATSTAASTATAATTTTTLTTARTSSSTSTVDVKPKIQRSYSNSSSGGGGGGGATRTQQHRRSNSRTVASMASAAAAVQLLPTPPQSTVGIVSTPLTAPMPMPPLSTMGTMTVTTTTMWEDSLAAAAPDEQAVMKLLHLGVLIVQVSQARCHFHAESEQSRQSCLVPHVVTALLDTCWHVRHYATTASPQLKMAATQSAKQIVGTVFATAALPPSVSLSQVVTDTRCAILQKLSQLLVPDAAAMDAPAQTDAKGTSTTATAASTATASQPLLQQLQGFEFVAKHALSLLQSILVGCLAVTQSSAPLAAAEQEILQSTLIPNIMALALQTNHVVVLQQCLRLMNEMVDCLQLQNLKREFESFMSVVCLRRLNGSSSTSSAGSSGVYVSVEEKQVVLESLLEICHCHHTNMGAPVTLMELYWNYDCDYSSANLLEMILSALAHTAHPTATTVSDSQPVDETAKRRSSTISPEAAAVGAESGADGKGSAAVGTGNTLPPGSNKPPIQSISLSHETPLNHVNEMALDGILSVLNLVEMQCMGKDASSFHRTICRGSALREAAVITEEAMITRKQTKDALLKVALVFNSENPDKGDWLNAAVTEGLLQTTDDAKAVAELLHKLPDDMDKPRLGIYLSRGPDDSFPFQASARLHYTSLLDFSGMNFAAALRKYLSKFRLPGEAQCIDRLMESFSKVYFSQQKGSSMFANEDAVYVLAFSTIMLNTDLHNPTIKTEQRMTKEQFVRNNRGINGGNDLPESFVAELYDRIKGRALQVRATTADCTRVEKCDFESVWESVLESKKETTQDVFVLSGSRDRSENRVEKEVFQLLTKTCVNAIVWMFTKTWDDSIVVRTLRGLQQVVRLAAYFELDCVVNDVLQTLLPQGRAYIMTCITNDSATPAAYESGVSSDNLSIDDALGDDDNTTEAENDHNIPFGLLCSSEVGRSSDVAGSATNRGLLALDSSFVMLRKYSTRISIAWPTFIECLCVLRDARALPVGLSELDDFADSSGQVLPLSSFARASQKRLDAYHKSLSDKDTAKQKGWFRSFFRKGKTEYPNDSVEDDIVVRKGKLSACAKALLGVAEAADVENIVQMGSSQLPDATISTLLDGLDAYPFENDPAGEQHAVFTLELAARALLSSRERAADLFALFLAKFESLLVKVTDPDAEVPAPFVIERVVVTILRSSIHLYEYSELRPQLRASLQLLPMTLPTSFMKVISDRMACGLAIILRASYHFFETYNEWSLMGDMLDVLAHYSTSRVFVFDGIASTVEFAISNHSILQDSRKLFDDVSVDVTVDEDDDRPKLSLEGCSSLSRILTRFVLGFYQGDVSLTVPAMLCLEKVYRRKVEILLHTQAAKDGTEVSETDLVSLVPDKDFWQNVAVAVYSVCRSPDPDTSNEGLQCYLRIVLRTSVEQIPDEKWVAILYLMVNKQPAPTAEVSRGNTFAILGHLLTRLLPGLSHQADHREDLEELVVQYAALAEQNLQHSRGRGGLFEKTLQTLTYLSNLVISDDWTGDKEFSAWMNEVFLKELEHAGDTGGHLVMTTNNPEDLLDDVSEISDSVAEDDDNDMMGAPARRSYH